LPNDWCDQTRCTNQFASQGVATWGAFAKQVSSESGSACLERVSADSDCGDYAFFKEGYCFCTRVSGSNDCVRTATWAGVYEVHTRGTPMTRVCEDDAGDEFGNILCEDTNTFFRCGDVPNCEDAGSKADCFLQKCPVTCNQCEDTSAEIQCPALVVNYAGDDSSMQMLTGTYSMRNDCERTEGGPDFGNMDVSVCFEGPNSFLMWNTGCGWEIGRREQDPHMHPMMLDMYPNMGMMWQRYASTSSGACYQIPPEEVISTQTFFNRFGEVISGLTSNAEPSCTTTGRRKL